MRLRGSITKISGVGVILAVWAVGGCSRPEPNDPRLQPPKVLISRAETARPASRSFTGTVEARVQSDLGFRVGGKILERCVDVGQRVRKGQLLMRLDPVDLQLSAAALEANVEAARARYVQAKADETRLGKLVKSGVISPQDYDHVRAVLDSAQADLEAVEAHAKVSANSSGYAALIADVDGVVVQTLSEPGQVVTAGQTVIHLAHDGAREGSINLPEDVRPNLGSPALVRLYGRDREYRARLRQLSESADPVTRTFQARYVLEGEAASAPLGSTITIEVPRDAASDKELVLIPAGAVYDSGKGPGVWIVNDKNEVTFSSVHIASFGREDVTVSRGLKVGEPVVALGAHLLHEGQVISIATEEKISDGKL